MKDPGQRLRSWRLKKVPVAESIHTTSIIMGLLFTITLLAVILVRISSGFLALANQANILKFTGSIVCTMVVSNDNVAQFQVKLPSGNVEVDHIDVKGGPGILSVYSQLYDMAIPQYTPIKINKQT